jgi:hypothetical protein
MRAATRKTPRGELLEPECVGNRLDVLDDVGDTRPGCRVESP